MDYHKFVVSNQKEEPISIQRVKEYEPGLKTTSIPKC